MKKKQVIAVVLVPALCMTGCSGDSEKKALSQSQTSLISEKFETTETGLFEPDSEVNEETDDQRETEEVFESEESAKLFPQGDETEEFVHNEEKEKIQLTATQKNSIAMLNYLSFLTQDINSSANSRLYLEEAYSFLVNNIYPNAVDNTTQIYLTDLLDTLNAYRMVAVKRERLEYIYEQNKAQAINAAVPSPLGLLSAVKSFNLVDLVGSVVYMAVDSASSYNSASNQATMEYLEAGWALDDEQSESLHESRSEAFSYMLDIVRDYELPGEYALNEDSVEDFVLYKNDSNNSRRIQFLESKDKDYREFGSYWILLADSYYKEGEYRKCLNAIDTYDNMGVRILRKNYELAKVLPLAIAASEELYNGQEYVDKALPYLQKLIENLDDSDWALNYFAAQTYIDLYSVTDKKEYLENAYEITLNNVNSLISEQKNLNDTYLASVVKQEAEKDATKAEKKEIKQYNKMLDAERKVELPPIYEPLMLNCNLLFELVDLCDIDDLEREKIDRILHEEGNDLFLISSIDTLYRDEKTSDAESEILFIKNGTKLVVPANQIAVDGVIKVTVTEDGEKYVYDDWKIEKVERGEDDDISTFMATFSSASIKNQKYSEDSMVTVEIEPKKGSNASIIKKDFMVKNYTKVALYKDIDFVVKE